MDFLKKNGLYVSLGAIGVAIIGLFLPFWKISFLGISTSVNFFQAGQGKLTFVALLAAAVLLFLDKEKKVAAPVGKIALGALAAAVALTIYNMIDVSKASAGLGSLAIGAYLCLIGSAVALIVVGIKTFLIKE